jgi:hypothetical protein
MKYTDSYCNICTHYVDQPKVIFALSNVIDTLNRIRQDSLKLEKKWVMHIPRFRLATTLVVITITDIFLLSTYHHIINVSKWIDDDQESKVSIQRFARILVHQLINLSEKQREISTYHLMMTKKI